MTFMEQSANYGFENNEGRGVKNSPAFFMAKGKENYE